jgi:8-oxo-dGTP pyrophosphatase MutT (NUDIX family)
MVEQYRYPLGLRRWEFPQGTAPDRAVVPPEELAARELREETGLRAATWSYLGLLDVAPGLSSQRGRAYLATDLTAGQPAREDTEADMRFAWVPRAEFEARARAGEITDAQTLAAYALLLLRAW